MVKEEKSRDKDVYHTKKKSRARRELDKLVFSVNYDQPMGNRVVRAIVGVEVYFLEFLWYEFEL